MVDTIKGSLKASTQFIDTIQAVSDRHHYRVAARARHLPRYGARGRPPNCGDLLYDNYFDCHRAERSPGALDAISRRPKRSARKNHSFYSEPLLTATEQFAR